MATLVKLTGICKFTPVPTFKTAEAWKINFHIEEQPGSIFINTTFLAKKIPLSECLGKNLFYNAENDIINHERR